MMIGFSLFICFIFGYRYGCGLGALAFCSIAYYLASVIGVDLKPEGELLIALFVLSAPIAALLSNVLIQKYCFPEGLNRSFVGIFILGAFWLMINSFGDNNSIEYLMLALNKSTSAHILTSLTLLCKNILLFTSVLTLAVIGFTLAFEIPFQWLSHIVLRSKTERLQGARILLVILAISLGLQLISDACFRFLNPEFII